MLRISRPVRGARPSLSVSASIRALGAVPGPRGHRTGWLAAVPLALALTFSVFPSAQAGRLPVLVRRVTPGLVLQAVGPAATEYPYRAGATPGLDAAGFVIGQCTSFAAWWLNSRGLPFGVVTMGPRGAGWFLNASSWDAAARAAGFAGGSRPAVGAVAQWRAGESSRRRDPDGTWHLVSAGAAGHVAIVIRVLPDGQAEWLDYGFGGRAVLHHGFGFAPRYLYLGITPPRG
ncbi:MAG TPA: CHAP domain-containing protein [Kineosporiaceae bacterium]